MTRNCSGPGARLSPAAALTIVNFGSLANLKLLRLGTAALRACGQKRGVLRSADFPVRSNVKKEGLQNFPEPWSFPSLCPGGTCENSPTFQFQRWDLDRRWVPVPKGPLTVRRLSRPFGTYRPWTPIPNVQTLGYSHQSLRDTDQVRSAAVPSRSSPESLRGSPSDLARACPRKLNFVGNFVENFIGNAPEFDKVCDKVRDEGEETRPLGRALQLPLVIGHWSLVIHLSPPPLTS